jgi:hypothetical protein
MRFHSTLLALVASASTIFAAPQPLEVSGAGSLSLSASLTSDLPTGIPSSILPSITISSVPSVLPSLIAGLELIQEAVCSGINATAIAEHLTAEELAHIAALEAALNDLLGVTGGGSIGVSTRASYPENTAELCIALDAVLSNSLLDVGVSVSPPSVSVSATASLTFSGLSASLTDSVSVAVSEPTVSVRLSIPAVPIITSGLHLPVTIPTLLPRSGPVGEAFKNAGFFVENLLGGYLETPLILVQIIISDLGL